MKSTVLKQAEKKFLKRYPGGFAHPEMVELGKKHKMDQHTAFAKDAFAKSAFDEPAGVVEDLSRLVSRSSMVSMFEKPKFKDMVRQLKPAEKLALVDAVYELLHGKEKAGFESLVEQLGTKKMAKWTIVTVVPAYYRPNKDVFIKPSTAKLIVDKLGLDMTYKAKPSWDFYRDFRKQIKAARAQVSKSLAPNNPAFCGFLMVTLGGKI